MNLDRPNCPFDEIAAYIDGELSPARELELDLHFASCGECNAELNEQKLFLRGLELTLKQDELPLPKDFAKVVIANAESRVEGLRPSRERYNAIFICTAILLFVLFATGAEAFSTVEKITAIGSFFGHLVYSFFLGLAIIVRGISSQFEFGPTALAALAIATAGLSLAVSRRVLKARGV